MFKNRWWGHCNPNEWSSGNDLTLIISLI